MSYKLDTVISMLDEILMRLERIERLVDFGDEDAPEDVKKAFDKVFGKKVDKPKLTVVQSNQNKHNVVEFKQDE